MDPTQIITQLLHEWHQLTVEETRAIRNEDWPRVHEQQAGKAGLCSQISQALEKLRAARPETGPEGEEYESRMAAMVEDLVALEKANRDTLHAKMQHNRAEYQRSLQTVQNVRGVARAYGNPQPQLWHSYS